MITLGLDTSTPATAVALAIGGQLAQRRDDPPPGERPGHTTRLLAMADELLAEEHIGWDALQRIAVGLGPGTFTGLRVGIATARGLAQALSIELVGVSSLRALAHAAGDRAVLAVIDARRGEIFTAAYLSDGSGAPEELVHARALAPADIASVLELAGERGGGREDWVAVGDGAVRYRSALEAAGASVPGDSSSLHRLSAAAICALGERAEPVSALEQLLPDYVRRPDAEIALAGAQGAGAVQALGGAQAA